jgi:hypothetical protein
MATWSKMLKEKFEACGDRFEKMETTLSGYELIKPFDDGFGGAEGGSFTAWGEQYVYFPICYDGAEWVGCAPRNPCDIKMEHQGGG